MYSTYGMCAVWILPVYTHSGTCATHTVCVCVCVCAARYQLQDSKKEGERASDVIWDVMHGGFQQLTSSSLEKLWPFPDFICNAGHLSVIAALEPVQASIDEAQYT